IAAVAGVAVLLALAAPFLGARFGFPDAGNAAEDKSVREAYDMTTEAFGSGANGPLLLAADISGSGAAATVESVAQEIASTDGVASVSPPVLNEAGDTAVFTVVPTTGPQDDATADLVVSTLVRAYERQAGNLSALLGALAHSAREEAAMQRLLRGRVPRARPDPRRAVDRGGRDRRAGVGARRRHAGGLPRAAPGRRARSSWPGASTPTSTRWSRRPGSGPTPCP
ncbi:MAG: hypothetical protein KY453_07655, partial [Gemmatimonadetes bacterium]|nr:hypothetical protein [Gemmatimonadota bacterium]